MFLENGVAAIKQLPCPSKIASFSGNLNGEALLKVSFKNIDWFQKYKALKSKIVKKAQFHKENEKFSTSKLCNTKDVIFTNFSNKFQALKKERNCP